MKALKKLWDEFKAFIARGSVLDLAVGVVVGAAFTAIVTSLTDDILMPLINSAVGDGDFSAICTVLKAVYVDGVLDTENSIIINWGNFIQAIIDFILVAIVIFAIVKVINSVHNASNKLNSAAKKEKKIRKLEKQFVKQGLSHDDAKAKAVEQYAKDNAPAPAEPAKPTTEELLAQIRDLLMAQNATKDVAAEGMAKEEEAPKELPSESSVTD